MGTGRGTIRAALRLPGTEYIQYMPPQGFLTLVVSLSSSHHANRVD